MSYKPHLTKNRNLPPDWRGPKWWLLEFWPDGRKREKGKDTCKPFRPQFYGTENECKKFHNDILLGMRPDRQISTNPKLDGIYTDFLAWYKTEVTGGTLNDFLSAWNRFGDFFGPYRLSYINGTLVQQYKQTRMTETYIPGKPGQPVENDDANDTARRKHFSKRSVNKELSYLSKMIKWAEDQDPPLVEPGSIRIKLYPKKQTQRAEPILPHSTDEVDALIAAIGDLERYGKKTCNKGVHQHMAKDRYGLCLLMYNAGLRKSEALKIEANRVMLPSKPIKRGESIDYGTITVIRKGGRVQVLPILTKHLYAELKERLKKKKTGYLYTNPLTKKPYVDIRDGIKSAGKAAGVNKKNNPHLFRHDYVTHLHESGVDMKSISELVGHSNLATTSEIYSHLTTNTLRDRAQNFSNRINAIKKMTGHNKKSK
jgi:site-specific recombinase XerD